MHGKNAVPKDSAQRSDLGTPVVSRGRRIPIGGRPSSSSMGLKVTLWVINMLVFFTPVDVGLP